MKRLLATLLIPLLMAVRPAGHQQRVGAAIVTDSLSLDLPALKANRLLTGARIIRVADDPVFHGPKAYLAIPLKTLLARYTSLRKLNVAQTQIVFECADGYNPSMALSKVLERDAWLAIRDQDAPAGQDWVDAVKDGKTKRIAPFYVVYTNVPAGEHDYKWPYNLVKISLVQTAVEYAAIYPHEDDTMVKGFGLFQRNCSTCHALNKIGGHLGPELNYPKSVMEYWRTPADVKAFIKQPTAYRHACKMPAITYLTDNELDEIIRYLQYMAAHKVKG